MKPEPTKEEKAEVGAAGEDKPVATPEAGEPAPVASPQEEEEGKKGKDGGISQTVLNCVCFYCIFILFVIVPTNFISFVSEL